MTTIQDRPTTRQGPAVGSGKCAGCPKCQDGSFCRWTPTPPPDDLVQLRDSTLLPAEGASPLEHRPARSVGLPFVELRLVAWALERTV